MCYSLTFEKTEHLQLLENSKGTNESDISGSAQAKLQANTTVKTSQKHTFAGMSVPEHHLGVGAKALHVVHRGGPADAAHALSGGGRGEAGDGRSCRQRVLLARVAGMGPGPGLVRVRPLPGALG